MSVKQTPGNRIGKGKPGPGRPKGIPNKTTTAVKEMVLAALNNKGGVEYLERQAEANPTAFLTLVGKVIPLQADVSLTGKTVTRIELVALESASSSPA